MNKGFTLIELMIYSAILGIFLMVMTTLFTSTLDLQLETESVTTVAGDSRYIFSRFSHDIGRATAITVPASLGEEAASLELTIDGQEYAYRVNNGTLELTTDLSTDALSSVGSTISGVRFVRLGNDEGEHSIQIHITVASITQLSSGPEERTYQTTIALR